MRQLIGGNEDSASLAAKLNANFVELYSGALGEGVAVLNIPFNTTISLNNYLAFMPAQSVSGPLAFVLGPNPVKGCAAQVVLTADGNSAHVPSFAGFTQETGYPGWNNTNGHVNTLCFHFDGTIALCRIIS